MSRRRVLGRVPSMESDPSVESTLNRFLKPNRVQQPGVRRRTEP